MERVAILRLIWSRKFLLLAIIVLGISGVSAQSVTPQVTPEATAQATPETTPEAASAVEHLVPKILATYPHDPTAFTEGLFLSGGHFYESTGEYGQSTIREVDPTTGKVLESTALPAQVFGEGISQVGKQVFQLTWREGVGFVYDSSTLKLLGTFPYNDEGWGMCYDGMHLFTSNGSDQITERDATTFQAINMTQIHYQGLPIDQINELECVNDTIYANVWHTYDILRIDKASGNVTGLIDASNLLTAQQRNSLTSTEAVLNGIAYDSANDVFYITGKLWPWMFKVQFVPAA